MIKAGAAQGLLKGSIMPSWIHLSICLSITSLFAGELGKGGREIGLAPGFRGICTFASKCPNLSSRPKAIWLSFRIRSSRCFLIGGSSGLMSNSSIRRLLFTVSSPTSYTVSSALLPKVPQREDPHPNDKKEVVSRLKEPDWSLYWLELKPQF